MRVLQQAGESSESGYMLCGWRYGYTQLPPYVALTSIMERLRRRSLARSLSGGTATAPTALEAPLGV
jgi:aspartate/methionine/tyrosine aminotransferase